MNDVLTCREVCLSGGDGSILDAVDLTLQAGRCHVLLGPSGAGKTTLADVLAGRRAPDSGSLSILGQELPGGNPAASLDAGCVVISPEGPPPPDITVAEFLSIPSWHRRGRCFTRRQLCLHARDVLFDQWIEGIDETRSMLSLDPFPRLQVTMAAWMAAGPAVLVLDEPLAGPCEEELQWFQQALNRAHDAGCAVLLLTRSASMAMRLGSEVTVLRDGRTQGTFDAAVAEALAAARAPSAAGVPSPGSDVQELLTLEAVELAGVLEPLDAGVRAGTILGLAGGPRSGAIELLEALGGLRGPVDGHVLVQGRLVAIASVSDAVTAGLVLIPRGFGAPGIVPELTVDRNVTLSVMPRLLYRQLLTDRHEALLAQRALHDQGMIVSDPRVLPETLGPLQRRHLLLAKAMLTRPRVLLLHEPLRWLHQDDRQHHARNLRTLAASHAVVVASGDATELAALCDEVLILHHGRITSVLRGGEVTAQAIDMALCRR